jgi:branched-chain amino acid transport system ATP-binding protein
MALLELEGIAVRYGPVPALRDLSLRLDEGETLGVVGPNGAGKTTLTLAIAGALPLSSGTVRFEGRPTAGLRTEDVSALGIALVPEGRRIFDGLTVQENLIIGMSKRLGDRAARARALDEIHAMFPILAERRNGMATRLSGGEQQQLAIARALLSRPRLLVLDEPSLGLAPLMVDKVYEVLLALRKTGLSILLVEQNPMRIGIVADRLIVLSGGSLKLEGPARELLGDVRLEQAYLSGEGGGA